MIESLRIENYAIIDNLKLEFRDHFNVFTGETGAGKSIIIGALSLLIGERADASIISHGKDHCIVEGVFTLSDNMKIILDDADILYEDNICIVRRTISLNRSSIKINDYNVTLSFLQKLFAKEIDIHSQRDNQYLLHKNNHLVLLDAYAEDNLLFIDFQNSYQKYLENVSEYNKLLASNLSEADLDYFRYSLDELTNADLKPGEEEELLKIEKRLKVKTNVLELLNNSLNIYDRENGLNESFYELYNYLKNDDEELMDIHNHIGDLYYLLQDEIEKIRQIKNGFDEDEANIDEIESRLFDLTKLKRKYNKNIAELISYTTELKNKIDFYNDSEEYLLKAKNKCEESKEKALIKAGELSSFRQKKAKKLESAIKKELADLMLKNSNFKVHFKEKELNENGIDDVEFMISLNAGENLKPLIKVASGGELSRLMLGLKTVFSALTNINILVFDEIDTGVSGTVALAIGLKMSKIAKDNQVFSITHLAPVAACGDSQYLIFKKEENGYTHTKVKLLDNEERIQQLALLATGNDNDNALKAAKDLLSDAQMKVHENDHQ